MNSKTILFTFFLLLSSSIYSQVIKPASINRMVALVQQQDSIPLLKGEEKTNVFGGTYNASTLAPMGNLIIDIEEYSGQPKPFALSIQIPVSKTVTMSSLKYELKSLIKTKSIKGSWKMKEDIGISLYYTSTDKIGIHLVKDMQPEFINLKIYNTEGQEE